MRIDEFVKRRTITAGSLQTGSIDVGQFGTDHGRDVVLAERAVILGLEAAVKTDIVIDKFNIFRLVTDLHGFVRLIRLVVVELEVLDQRAGLVAREVERTVGGKPEALHPRNVVCQVDGVVEVLPGRLRVTGSLGIQQRGRVHVLVHAGIVERVVLGMDADPRLGSEDVVEDVPLLVIGTHTLVVGLADGRSITHGQVLGQIHGDVRIQVVTLVTEGIALEDGVVFRITGTEIIVDCVGTAGKRGVVLLVDGELVIALLVPVGIDRIVHVTQVIRPGREALFISLDLGIRETVAHLGHICHLVVPLHEGSPALHLSGDVRLGKVHGSREVHGRLLGRTLLGRDEDDTVLGTETVDGRGSIFQDGDALDIIRVEFLENGDIIVGFKVTRIVAPAAGDLTLAGHTADDTVHDDHRVAVTTDAQVRVELTRLTAVLLDLESGNLALQSVHAVRRTGGGDIFGTDLGDGSRQRLTLLHAVTDHDRLVQQLGVFHQDDVHLGGRLELAGLKADR